VSRTTGEPRITVVIPCFNDGPLATEAIASLADQEPVELVVVDDASTDPGTLSVFADLVEAGVRVIRHDTNRGLSAARMTGLRATAAPFVFPLDADDLLTPGSLTPMAELLASRPEIGVAFADYEEWGTRSRVVQVPARLDAYRVAYRNEYPVASLFRRELLERLGGWHDVGDMIGYEDWNLWMTMAERGERGLHVGAGTVAMRRRLHGTRMLSGSERNHRALYAELRRLHPVLFAEIRSHRRRSDLSPAWRWLYPLLYGARPPLGLRTALTRATAGASSDHSGS
jgi:glycosyltransferase involved in cell wall biosynthesis